MIDRCPHGWEPYSECITCVKNALNDLHRQVAKFCEEEGEWEFYTGNALAALGKSDNPVHLQTLRDLAPTQDNPGGDGK